MEHTIDQDSGFIFPETQDNGGLIKVIGVGGGGGNAVNHLYEQGVKGVTFGMINTDNQALRQSPVPTKIVMGGRGAGGKPEVAKHAAERHRRGRTPRYQGTERSPRLAAAAQPQHLRCHAPAHQHLLQPRCPKPTSGARGA